MQQKDFMGMVLLAIGLLGGLLLTSTSKRARDVFFVVMVFLAPMTEQFDINFVSRDFYRGTTRGFEVSLVDILSISLLVSSVLFPRRGESRIYWPASLGFMLLYLLYSCFNVAVSDPKLFGSFELLKMVRGLTIFLAVVFYLRSERELRLLLLTLGVLVCFEAALALKQRYLNGVHRVYGTIDDSNSLSVFFCTTAPVLAAMLGCRLPKAFKLIACLGLVGAGVGVVLTICRTGVMTFALVMLGVTMATIGFQITARKLILGMVFLLAATGIVAKSWKTLQVRFKDTDLKADYNNKKLLGRGYYLRIAKAIGEVQWSGVGLNNWSYWVSNKYGPRLGYKFVPYKGTDKEPSTVVPEGSNVDTAQAAPAHNLAALTLGELGFPGLVLFLVLWLRWFQIGSVFLWRPTPDPMRRIGIGLFFALVGVFVHCLTEWVFRQSPIYYVVHILLGALVSLYYIKRREQQLPVEPRVQPITIPTVVEVEPAYARSSLA